MAKIKITILDDDGLLLQEKERDLDLGQGRFDEIEKALIDFQQKEMKEISSVILESEQAKYLSKKKTT